MTAEHWFIDENKSNGLMLAVVAVPTSVVGSCRTQMAKLAAEPPRNGRPLHFYSEEDKTRSQAFRKIQKMPIHCAIIRVSPKIKLAKAREIAFRFVGQLAVDRTPQRILFEADESTIKNDRRWLSSEIPKGTGVEYQHLPKSGDPLLWIPDGIAWAVNRGGHWLEMVKPVITEEFKL